MIGSWRLRGRGESRQQIGEPTEIVVAEMGAARPDHDRGIIWLDVGPAHRQAGELARVLVEVDAILTPRLPALDQSKRTPTQRMEGMGDAKGLRLTTRWRCNRRLTPIRSSSA